MKNLILFLLVAVLSGCNDGVLDAKRVKNCLDGKPHVFGKWEDITTVVNGMQKRYCQKCGVIQREWHE